VRVLEERGLGELLCFAIAGGYITARSAVFYTEWSAEASSRTEFLNRCVTTGSAVCRGKLVCHKCVTRKWCVAMRKS